jgi:hypothetical protein
MTFFMSLWASIKIYVGIGPKLLVVKREEETLDGFRKHLAPAPQGPSLAEV